MKFKLHDIKYQTINNIKKIPTKVWILLFMVMIFTFALINKPNANNQQEGKTFVVKAQESNLPLYFNGTVKPLHVYSITSPVEGAVAKKYFNYGQQVKKGDLLLALSSTQLSSDYQAALTEYLKDKESYTNTNLQKEGADELFKLGIISRNTYREQMTQANDAALAFMQAKQKLLSIINKAQLNQKAIIDLNISELEHVNQAISQYFGDIKVYATADGIVLLPDKADSSSDSNQKIDVGSQIKNGQLLLSIGDLTGITFVINVNEININAIKVGQNVTINSPAFLGITLQGKVTDITLQATIEQSGGLPTFEVKITVPTISPKERTQIHVGMSANVELNIAKPPIISIPLKAIYQNKGKSMVKVVDKQDQQVKEREVVTGQTTLDNVEIQQGLAVGDEILIHD